MYKRYPKCVYVHSVGLCNACMPICIIAYVYACIYVYITILSFTLPFLRLNLSVAYLFYGSTFQYLGYLTLHLNWG